MSKFNYKGKKVYYEEQGKGMPMIIIHGNTVSGKMNKGISKRLKNDYWVISIDLPGHGRSDRIDQWPVDYWFEHAGPVIALIDHLNLSEVILIGSSGGAQIALNVALEAPEKVQLIVADSFEGGYSIDEYAYAVEEERRKLKTNLFAKMYWKSMHGPDWQDILDKDTRVTIDHHKNIGKFFHDDLSRIKVPVLLTGSRADVYFKDYDKIFAAIQDKIPHAEIVIYDKGRHPAMTSSTKQMALDIKSFISHHLTK